MSASRVWCFGTILLVARVVCCAQSVKAVQPEALVGQLGAPDPSVRGAAKLTLMASPDPEALPFLLKALPNSQGDFRSNLIEVLKVYKNPQKLPALISAMRPFHGPPGADIEQQFTELGAAAAEALMRSVPDECSGPEWEPAGYSSWVAGVIGGMHPIGLSTLLAALRTASPCKQHTAEEAMDSYYSNCCDDAGTRFNPPIDVTLLVSAVKSDDTGIRSAVSVWIDSLQGSALEQFEPAGVVEVLIKTYQSNRQATTMAEIATLLAGYPSPRVDRFMRAAVNAPNPQIQETARKYLAENAPHPAKSKAPTEARTSEQKIRLAKRLGDSDDSANTSRLVKLLTDADPRVRAAAAAALGNLNQAATDSRDERERDVEGSIPPLLKELSDASPEVRAASAQAIGEIRAQVSAEPVVEPELTSRLLRLLKDPHESVVAAAASSLGLVRDPNAVPELALLVTHSSRSVRVAATSALSAIDAKATVCALVQALADADSGVRYLAARGLNWKKFAEGERCPGDLEALLRALADPQTAEMVIEPLGRLKDSRAIQPLLQNLEERGEVTMYCHVCTALAEIGDKSAVQPLLKYLDNSNPVVWTGAVETLATLDDPQAVQPLAALLKDSRAGMRASAIQALNKMNQCQLMPEMRKGLTDDSSIVRIAAADAADKCHDLASVSLLIHMLASDLAPAAKALGDLGDKQATDFLLAIIHQKHLWNSGVAAHALGQIRDPRAVEGLIDALDSDSAIEAAWALGEIGDARAVPPLQHMVRLASKYGSSMPADSATAALVKLHAIVPAREGTQ